MIEHNFMVGKNQAYHALYHASVSQFRFAMPGMAGSLHWAKIPVVVALCHGRWRISTFIHRGFAHLCRIISSKV